MGEERRVAVGSLGALGGRVTVVMEGELGECQVEVESVVEKVKVKKRLEVILR